jgi:alginate O-acetyltransferase complex protein AlgI
VFFLCGLWHGATWMFVLWGLYHGALLVVERVGLARFLSRLHPLVSHLYTLLAVLGGWVLFRSESLGQAAAMFRAMAGLSAGSGGRQQLGTYLTGDVAMALVLGAALSTPIVPLLARWWKTRQESARQVVEVLGSSVFQTVRLAGMTAIFGLCAIWLASGTHNPFIYFRF